VSISKQFKSFLFLAFAGLALVSVNACSGMSGSGLGGSNLATDSNDSHQGSGDPTNLGEKENNPTILTEFRHEGAPVGGEQIQGGDSGTPGSGPGTITPFSGSPTTVASAGSPSGYRPGSEGQVQHGPNVFISVSALDSHSNCKKPLDQPWDELFKDGSFPTLYYWLSNEENGSDAKGYNKTVNEYGKVAFYCNDASDPTTQFNYITLLATYTDAGGKVHRSETSTYPCPNILKGESAEFCLTLPADARVLRKAGAVDVLQRNAEPSELLFKPKILENN